MYGFRGMEHCVDVLSPYEMLMHWSAVKILPPNVRSDEVRSQWTQEGKDYMKQCKDAKEQPSLHPGLHYTAVSAPNRIRMPDLIGLKNLRHRWCWERRMCPHTPVWSFSKVSCDILRRASEILIELSFPEPQCDFLRKQKIRARPTTVRDVQRGGVLGSPHPL